MQGPLPFLLILPAYPSWAWGPRNREGEGCDCNEIRLQRNAIAMRLQCDAYAKQCDCNALLSDCNAMRLQHNGEDAIGWLLHCGCNAMRCDCNATQSDGTISPSASLPSVFSQGPRVRREDKCEESGSGGGFSLLGQGGHEGGRKGAIAMQYNAMQSDCIAMRL